MLSLIVRHSRGFLRWLCLLMAVLLCGFWGMTLPAQALLREITEQPGQTLIQSRQTLRDDHGQTWQVVLFKRQKDGNPPEINLRLVGFPGVVAFRHPAPLTVHPNAQNTLTLADVFEAENPGENVGQFVVSEAFEAAPLNGIWELDLPLAGEEISLKIPYFVLQEWQTLLQGVDSP